MDIGFPSTLTAYDLLKDQGGVVGGLLAFGAGLLAYCAGRAQATAVDKQNEEFKRTERRRLARSCLVAARLTDEVLAGIEDDISRELAYVSYRQGQDMNNETALAIWKKIRKPELSTVWDQLGVLDREIISKYMNLDREIAKKWETDFLAPTVVTINSMLDELSKLQVMIDSLRGFLKSDFDKVNSVLCD